MDDTWLIRWDSRAGARPRILTGSPSESIDVQQELDGSFIAFDGWLGEPASAAAEPGRHAAELWREFGEHSLDRLRGNFVLAAWREGARSLVVARDAMGSAACWWFQRGGLFLLSPSLRRLVSEPEVGRTIRRAALAEHALGTWSTAQRFESLYQDVARLPSGHLLEVRSAGAARVRRWFEAVATPLRWADTDELATFPAVLARAVRRCLAGGADCLALSGGFDSVSIAILAAAESAVPPIHALSVHFTDPVCDESAVQSGVARALGLPHTLRRLEDGLDGEDVISAGRHLAADGPGPALSPWDAVYLALLRDAKSAGKAALMTGAGGDELLGVSTSYGVDALLGARFGDLATFVAMCRRAYGASYTTLSRQILWPAARSVLDSMLPREGRCWLSALRLGQAIPSWIIDKQLREELVDRGIRSAKPVRPRHLYETDLRTLLDAPLLMLEQEQAHAWARASGFRLMTPFFDPDVVQLLLRVRPQALLAGGYPKAPLRRLVAGGLASVQLPAKKVDFTTMAHATLRGPGKFFWKRLGGPRRLAALGIVDSTLLERDMNDYFDGRNEDWSRVWLTLSAETWLRAQNA